MLKRQIPVSYFVHVDQSGCLLLASKVKLTDRPCLLLVGRCAYVSIHEITILSCIFIAGMTVPEQFSLRWNDFQTNLSHGIHTFLECEDLVDVTLAAGGEFMRAHKLILSICSPYFKSLFKVQHFS